MALPSRLAGLLVAAALHAAAAAAPLPVREVAPGVWLHTGAVEDWAPASGGDVANLGFVVGRRCVAVIDAGGTPAVGAALREAVAAVTPLPVCWVVTTHVHPDHVLGNVAFRGLPGVCFAGHAKLAASLAARQPFYRQALQRVFGQAMPEADIVPPDTPVADALELDLGERVLRLQAWPTAHTDNDLSVYDEQTRTLFTGDLLFVGHLPVVDGSLVGWLRVMDRLSALDAVFVVPGHGAAGRDAAAMFAPQRRYLEGLRDAVRAAVRAHEPLSQAVARIEVPAGTPWQLTEQFHRRNVTAAYAELEWEE